MVNAACYIGVISLVVAGVIWRQMLLLLPYYSHKYLTHIYHQYFILNIPNIYHQYLILNIPNMANISLGNYIPDFIVSCRSHLEKDTTAGKAVTLIS